MADRVTPEEIGTDLTESQVFVFGSNESGIHGAGAARMALDHFGAKIGKGFGPMGQSFGIPTKDWQIKVLPLSVVEFYVKRFEAFVNLVDDREFLVTKIGCGLAGFTPDQIAPMFAGMRNNKKVWLPQDFIDIIDGNYVKINEHGRTEIYRGGKLSGAQG